MRFLILTLASGENELEACRSSVTAQCGVSTEHRVISNLPKSEAHARLYGTIMSEGDRFDRFVKLDADMVLAGDDVLERIAGLFDRLQRLDHLVLGVADWYTDGDIIGVHAFSRRARWLPNPSGLFTDPDPVFPGRKLVIEHPRPIAVLHGPDPSPVQAFYFGVHRAMKACQRDLIDAERQPFSARTNWRTLGRLWHHYRRSGDYRLALAVYGADLVLCGKLPMAAVDRQSPELAQAFRAAEQLEEEEIRRRLGSRWSRGLARQLLWRRAMGPGMAFRVVGRFLRDGLAAPLRLVRRHHQRRVARLWNDPVGTSRTKR